MNLKTPISIPIPLFLKITFFIVVALTTAVITVFYMEARDTKPTDLEEVKVSLVWLNQAQFAGIYTAVEKGFYEDEGLDVIIEEFDFEKQLDDDLAEGKIDFSVTHAVRLLEAVGRGLPIKAIGTIFQKSPHAFITTEEKAINTPKDLEGKILGSKGGNSSAKILYSVLLSEFGVPKNKVEMKSVSFDTDEYDDITSGSVDIVDLYITDQIYFFEKENTPYDLLLPEEFGFSMYGDVIATSNELLENRPEIAEKFMRATAKGWDYALDNQKEAAEITYKYVEKNIYKDMDYQSFILKNSEKLIKPNENRKIGEMNFTEWRKLHDIMNENNLFEQNFDITNAYTTKFIE